MGLFDVITGKRKLAKPAPDRLFAMTTAVRHASRPSSTSISRGKAAIVFQALATADFDEIVKDMEEVVRATGDETGTTIETDDDKFGYRWMILRDADFEDLVVGINAVSSALEAGGYGERLLCAVFAFEDATKRPRLLDLQLQARRLLPVRARRATGQAARQRARAAAQGPAWAPSCRSSPSSSAGSPSGGSRSTAILGLRPSLGPTSSGHRRR